MDPSRSSYPHHATRYAAFPPPPQQPPPPSDYYRTIPPQFRPPQHPFLRPPPPPSPNPQFSFSPSINPTPQNYPSRDIPSRRIPDHHHHYIRQSRPQPHEFRVLRDDSRLFDTNVDSREGYNRQFPVRTEYDSVEFRKRDDVVEYRSSFGVNRDYRVASSQVGSVSRSLDVNSGSFESRRELDRGENVRDMRELLIERGTNEIGDNEVRVFGVKREVFRSREGNVEGRGSRESSHEYNRTPRKQVQKKSALLRIQKPGFWNREDERMHHSAFYDDGSSKSTSFWGSKDQNVHVDRQIREDVREGSPVHLDVSFKSNSLVAKAIVTPNSSNAAVSDVKLEPRSTKARKVLILDNEGAGKSNAKPTEDNVKLDKLVSVRNAPPSSDRDLRDFKERVSDSGKGSVCVTSSSLGSGGNNVLPVNGRMKSVIEKGGTNISSGKTSLPKVAKKKKMVKRVVKKVSNPNLNSSASKPTRKSGTNVKAARLSCGKPTSSVAGKPTAVAMDIVDSESCAVATIAKFKDNIVEPFSEAKMSMKVGSEAEAEADMLCVHNHKRKRSDSASPQVSPRHAKSKFDEKLANENPLENLDTTANAEDINKISSNDIYNTEDVRRSCAQVGDSSFMKNDASKGSSEVLFSIKGNTDFPPLSSERLNMQEATSNECTTTTTTTTTTRFDNLSSNSQKDITVSGTGSVILGMSDSGMNEGTQSVINAGVPVISSETVLPSKSGETETYKGNFLLGLDSTNHKEDSGLACGSLCNNAEELKSPAQGTNDIIGEHFSSERVVDSSMNTSMGECLSNVFTLGGNTYKPTNILADDENAEMCQFDLSGSEVNGAHLESSTRNSPTNWVDTTLRLSFRNINPIEVTGTRNCSNDVESKSCAVGTDVKSCTNAVSSGVNMVSTGSSPKNIREISDSQLEQFNVISSDINEGFHGACDHTSLVNSPVQREEEVGVSGMDIQCNSDLLSSQKEITGVIGNLSDGGFNTVVSARDGFVAEALIQEHSSNVEHSSSPKENSFCSLEIGDKHAVNETLVISEVSPQSDPMDTESVDGEGINMSDAEKQFTCENRIDLHQCLSKLQSSSMDEKLIGDDGEDDQIDVDSRLCPNASYPSSPIIDNRASVSNAGDELTISTSANAEFAEIISDSVLDIGVSETLPHSADATVSLNVSPDGTNQAEKPSIQGGPDLPKSSSGAQSVEVTMRSDHPVKVDESLRRNKGLWPSQYSTSIPTPNATNRELFGSKSLSGQSVSRIYPVHSPHVFNSSKSTSSSTHIKKARTWHRIDSSVTSGQPGTKDISSNVPAPRQLPKKVTPIHNTSYVRKGNSLVRKPTSVAAQSPVCVYQSNSSDKDEVLKTTGMVSRMDAVQPPNFVTVLGKGSFERPGTPPLPNLPKITSHTSNSLDDQMCSPPAEPLHNNSVETMIDLKLTESSDVPKSSEDVLKISESPIIHNGQVNMSESQNELNDRNVASSNVNSITYVKRKSNQLVATSNSSGLFLQNAVSAAHIPTDGYYKRRKNQIIRTSLESLVERADTMANENLNSKNRDVISGHSKKRLTKDVTRMRKPSRLSLVWTLHGTQLSKSNSNPLHGQIAFPHFFPWKRAAYWRSFIGNSPSSSTISKLLLLRKRDTIYTRSKHGFSLVKSKVLSVDGSGLKWSKSIEKDSKKANEEATLAVAEADRKKRERSSAARIISRTKSRNNSSRERTFRIGSVRYKMDSSGRTLQRLSDDETPCSEDAKTGNDAKKSYIPKRLVIGKNEYVRVGSGNQLIRDPKKRTRTLASEKIRWSLHTARSRLAKKRKYCQFFTRFGKCNKDDGKCPYIHDPSKIAVCTKFLNGLCSNSDCKLTHKVIPERMPDCSYYLQGLCTNASCPYRHVHVNPKAPSCEGFLRGYCADGNECRKKHSYVCPVYEATGSCPEGSKCKLHHPKIRSKGKKRKQLRDKRSTHRRYFGSLRVKTSDLGTAVSERHSCSDDGYLFGSSIGDYISLDYSDEDARGNTDNTDMQATCSDGDSVEMESVDLDDLIRPVRIMNI